jgi:type 1 fimbriae regulatory protein FimB/type 1 fimbriae regulatory protein FimE
MGYFGIGWKEDMRETRHFTHFAAQVPGIVLGTVRMSENSKVPPRRRPNADSRGREHLTSDEVERLIKAASKSGRHGQRNATMILIAYRHGLRVSELVGLRRDQVDLQRGMLHVKRSKRGTPGTHPLSGREIRELRKVMRQEEDSPFVFNSERGPMDRRTFGLIVQRAGEAARLSLPVHPHMLRHGCGYYLANKGVDTRTIQAYLGHCNIQHTVRYTELSPQRFKKLWEE